MNNLVTPPRIRARAGLGSDGNWYFELGLWTLDGETRIGDPFEIGPFKDEKTCRVEMKNAAQLACEAVERGLTGSKVVSGKYIDMKAGGMLRPWEEQ